MPELDPDAWLASLDHCPECDRPALAHTLDSLDRTCEARHRWRVDTVPAELREPSPEPAALAWAELRAALHNLGDVLRQSFADLAARFRARS